MSTKIICIGGATIDRKLKAIHPLQLATSNRVTSATTFGGVAHNVAKNLASLTDEIYLQCVVGNDVEGQKILAHLKKSGIQAESSLVVNEARTAQYTAVLETTGELCVALADMDIYEHIPFDAFTESWQSWRPDDIIFVDTNLPASLIVAAIKTSQACGARLCIDPVSVTKAKKLPADLTGIFLLKPDRLEAETLTGIAIDSIDDCIKAGKILLDKGVKNTVISLGSFGYVVVNESCAQSVPAYQIPGIRDVSGAGDAFIAGILFELKQGSAILPGCELGAAAAAITLQSESTVVDEMSLTQLRSIISTQKLKESVTHATVF